jgi:hypothetical protein
VSCEATVVVEEKDLKGTCAIVLAHDLTTDIRDPGLNSREEELSYREKQPMER